MQSQGAYHTDTKHTYTYIHTRTHWTWCPLSGRPLYCGIVWTISSWMIKQCISQPSLWWRVCVWSSSECAALSTTACDMCERAREGVYFGCLSVYSHTLLCATYMRTSKCFELLWWAPVDCVSLLTRLPTAAPACEKLLLGPFNGETLVWEKVAKSWEKRALSRRGREGVNHERTCLWLHTHSCSARAHTQAHGLRNERMEKAQRTPQTQTCARFFCQRDKTRTIKNLIRNKANKHSCFTQYRGHTQTHVLHTCYHKVSYHTNRVWLNSQGKGSVCVCVCVCAFLDRVSLYDTKPSFLSLKFSVICLYKGLGYSFQATWTKIEAPVYGPKSTILPFLSVTYINPPIFSSRGPGSHSKGLLIWITLQFYLTLLAI